MPNTGTLPRSCSDAVARAVTAAGSPGPFERNTPSGAGQHVGAARSRRHDLDLAAGSDELVEDRALDPEVVRDHVQARVVGTDRVRLGSRDERREIAAVGAAVGLRGREQRVAVGGAERPRHRTGATDVTGEPARVDAGDACDLVAVEEPVEVVGRPPVRRPAREIAHDHAAAARRAASSSRSLTP